MVLGVGVPHNMEAMAIFHPAGEFAPWSYFKDEINECAVTVVQGYWSSFIPSNDPSRHRVNEGAKWQVWGCMEVLCFRLLGQFTIVDVSLYHHEK